jgi:hypothetical protein
MLRRKRNPHAKTAVLVALLMSATAVAPIFSLAPASAQLFPSRDRERSDRDRSFSRRIIVPEGTEIPVMYDEAEKILVTKDETVPVTLEVAANIRNRDGDLLIPYGSEIVGEIQPVESEEGSQFVAETLVIKKDGEKIRERSIDATSDVVTRTETVEEGASVGDILKGAAIGGAAAAVISAILGDQAIATEEVLGGAGLGALAGWVLGDGEAELISIDPNSDLTLTLNSDLVIRR